MRIVWAIRAHAIEEQADGSFTLRGVGPDRYAPTLPFDFPLELLVHIAAPPSDVGPPGGTMTLEVRGPNPVIPLFAREITVIVGTHPNNPPGWESVGFVHIAGSVTITEYGAHSIDLRLNDGETVSLPLLIAEP